MRDVYRVGLGRGGEEEDGGLGVMLGRVPVCHGVVWKFGGYLVFRYCREVRRCLAVCLRSGYGPCGDVAMMGVRELCIGL